MKAPLLILSAVLLAVFALAMPVSAQTNSTNSTIQGVNVTQFFSINQSAPANFTLPSNTSLGYFSAVAQYSSTDWGHYIFVGMPLVIIALAGKHYMWIAGLIASGLCLMVNIALGAEFFSTTALGAILFICIMMAIQEGG